MLPQNKRIPRQLFKELLLSRKYQNSEHFSLRIAEGEGSKARISVSVSKKVSKKASVRNKIRRRVYSSAHILFPLFKPGLYLFVAKTGAGEIKGEKLNLELAELVKKG